MRNGEEKGVCGGGISRNHSVVLRKYTHTYILVYIHIQYTSHPTHLVEVEGPYPQTVGVSASRHVSCRTRPTSP